MIRVAKRDNSIVDFNLDKIKGAISQAFDELDNEREYYQEKRRETNDKLISRKGLIGKIVGFTPMVLLFVGYLIIPLVVIGFLSMTEAFSTMATSI